MKILPAFTNPAHRVIAFLSAIFLFSVLTSPAQAQFQRARSHLEKIRSLANDIQPDKEESRLLATAKDMVDQANSMASALESVGETLARASGPFENERSEIYRAAAALRKDAQELAKQAQILINFIGRKSTWDKLEDYKKELAWPCQDVSLFVSAVLAKNWVGLETTIKKSQDWLREQLNAALTLRDNGSKPLVGLQKIEEEIVVRAAAIWKIKKEATARSFQEWDKFEEANRKENAAAEAYAVARASDADKSKLASLLDALKRAGADKKAAASAVFEADRAAVEKTNEAFRALSDIARPMEEIRTFVENANSDTINERWTNFEQWTKLLERDLSRS